jgi:hypothetical protein
MHNERLVSLTDEQLLVLAEEHGILSVTAFNRIALIEELSEELGLARDESLPTRLVMQRYAFLESHHLYQPAQIDFVFMDSYHESHLYMAIHSPNWAFVDWEIVPTLRDVDWIQESNKRVYLRIFTLQQSHSGYELMESFDIELQEFKGKLYIQLPHNQVHYKARLLIDLGDREKILRETGISFLVKSGMGPFLSIQSKKLCFEADTLTNHMQLEG